MTMQGTTSIIKRANACNEFISSLGMSPEEEDAENLVRSIRLIKQIKEHSLGAEWEGSLIGGLKRVIEQISARNGLHMLFSETDAAFVKLGKIPADKHETIRLVGANVWEW